MIGGDGREYGPVTADQLRQWILDHRANGATVVQAEGSTEWVPLGTLAEFREVLAEAAREHTAPPPPPTLVTPSPLPWPTTGTGELHVFDCLGRSWTLLQRHALLITGASLVVWGMQTLLALLGCFGTLVSMVAAGGLYGGLCVLVLKLARGEPAALGDVFACFSTRFLPCMLVWLFTAIASQVGLALCLLPGIFLSVVWVFSLPLTADRGLDFVPALQTSWRTAWPRFFPVLGLLALAYLPTVVFAIYSLVVTTGIAMSTFGPMGSLNFSEMMDKLPQVVGQAARLGFQQHLVLLLNLPFAWTATMLAYEDLLGQSRRPSA
jgi:hypothetical protein